MIFFRKKKKVEKAAPLKVVQKIAKPKSAPTEVEEKILTAEGWRRRKAQATRPKAAKR